MAGEAYHLSLQSMSDLTLEGSFDRVVYPLRSPIIASISVSDNAPIQGAWVTASVQRPDGTTNTLSLYDDGRHGDGLANDGKYAGSYSNTTLAGSYRFLD